GQLCRAGGRHLAAGVLLGVAAELGQARLVLGQRALALGQLARGGVLGLLGAAQQWVEAAGLVHAGSPSGCSSWNRALRLWSRSAARAMSWPRKSTISGQRASASSTVASLPRW